ncbi:hypothetical protein Barb7_00594 [Bacteroidales bacterium Barb7]|nr:hypothetical protein Barb7_00594 [Bacteroidales bacterium Barb7]
MFGRTLIRCPVKRPKVIVQPLEFILIQSNKSLRINLSGKQPAMINHQQDKCQRRQSNRPRKHQPAFLPEQPKEHQSCQRQHQTDSTKQMYPFSQLSGTTRICLNASFIISINLFHGGKGKSIFDLLGNNLHLRP